MFISDIDEELFVGQEETEQEPHENTVCIRPVTSFILEMHRIVNKELFFKFLLLFMFLFNLI